MTSLEPTPLTKKLPSDSDHKQSSSGFGSGGSSSRAESTRGTEAAASIAAATAAAIAAGPLSLVASASEAAAIIPMACLEVRGCTPVGSTASLFEINLGQQLVCLSSLEWPISLMGPPVQRVRRGSNSSSLLSIGENRRILLGSGGTWLGAGGSSGVRRPDRLSLKFRLSTLHTSDAEWLTLGQREGQLIEGAIQVSARHTWTSLDFDRVGSVVSIYAQGHFMFFCFLAHVDTFISCRMSRYTLTEVGWECSPPI